MRTLGLKSLLLAVLAAISFSAPAVTLTNPIIIGGQGNFQSLKVNGVAVGTGSGSVTSVSVASANGFGGSVATATSTPAITLTTSITGLLLGNGTAVSAYAGGSCTNQFFTSISASGAVTCTTDTLASAQHANQGTTTTVLHGNASGNPSWGSVAIGSDVSGLGTGVATALAANVGSSGAPVTFGGAGGTPSSLTLTNATGLPAAQVPAVLLTSGTSRTLANNAEIVICTSTCTVTPPGTLAAGQQFCVQNDDNVATVITLAAVSAIQYEGTARTSYGTANHTMTSGGAAADQICMVAVSTTKFNVFSSTGTWTNN